MPKGKTIAFRKRNTLSLAYCDTRVVILLSTFYTSDSQTIQRRLAKAKRGNIGSRTLNKTIRTEVKKPIVIVNYNEYMGGVDVADTSSYCFIRKTLKWWRKLFFWGLEVSVINSYVLYKDWSVRNEKVAMSHKKYRQTLLMSLIGARNKLQN